MRRVKGSYCSWICMLRMRNVAVRVTHVPVFCPLMAHLRSSVIRVRHICQVARSPVVGIRT